jgi:hypothetical protein
MSFDDLFRNERRLAKVVLEPVIFDRRMTTFGKAGGATYPGKMDCPWPAVLSGIGEL